MLAVALSDSVLVEAYGIPGSNEYVNRSKVGETPTPSLTHYFFFFAFAAAFGAYLAALAIIFFCSAGLA